MEYDILALKRKMLVKYPFFGRVITNVNFEERSTIETAKTDGKTIYYNPDFLRSLDTVNKQVFLLAHEVCHIAFDHIKRSEGKISKIWNIATDAVINQYLMQDGLEMIEGGVNIEEAIKYDADEMYEKLLAEYNKNNNERDNKTESKSGSQSETSGHDTHDMWEKAIENAKREKAEKVNKKQNIFDKLFNRSKNQEEKSELEKMQEELSKLGEVKAFEENKKEKKRKLEEIKNTNAKKSINPGMSSDGVIRKVNDIGQAKNIIDWRYVLREAINYDVDWSYNNAEIEEGVVIPNLEDIPIPETEILLDTSDSISEDLLKNFLRETKNVLSVSKIKVGCFDTSFYGFQEIRTMEDIENMTFQGGGGTNFQVALNAFSRRVENKIIFTDGEAHMPSTNLDVIWIVFGGKRINPPGGKVIYITDEQLNDLCSYEQRGFKR